MRNKNNTKGLYFYLINRLKRDEERKMPGETAKEFLIRLSNIYELGDIREDLIALSEKINVAFYAAKLHRTPKYLSGAIRRISGRSVAEWINSTLVSEIKMLLKTTDKTVLEISEELNFSSPSVMVQFFRHYTGITPLRYRKT